MKKKGNKESEELLRASITREMTKSRMAKSARKFETDLAAARIARTKVRKYQLNSVPLPIPKGAC
jgi:hypothetical protein